MRNEPVEKMMINVAYTLPNVVTTGPLHDESAIAVCDKFLGVSGVKVSDEDSCLSRSMTIKAQNKTVTVKTCSITGT